MKKNRKTIRKSGTKRKNKKFQYFKSTIRWTSMSSIVIMGILKAVK